MYVGNGHLLWLPFSHIFALFAVLAHVAGVFVARSLRLLAAAFGISLLVLLSSVVPDPWNLRFALWFPALPVLAFVFIVSRLRVRMLQTALVLVALYRRRNAR